VPPLRGTATRFAANVEMWWRDLPLVERARAAAALGFPAIEFWPHAGKDIGALAAATRELGLEVAQFTAWGFTPGLNETRHHDAFLRAIEAGCAVAKQLRCRKMTVVGGNDVPGLSRERMHDNIAAGLRRAAPIAAEHGIMLILEPMNVRVDHAGHCLYGSTDALRICRQVDSRWVKLNWELYHMQISEGDLCGHLREGIDQIGYVQLADHPGRREPGTGEIRYRRVLEEVRALGYTDFVGVECWPSGPEAEAAQRLAQNDCAKQ
jgi:hydroxypyruvate isomerase